MDRAYTIAQAVWNRWTDVVAQEPLLVAAVAGAIIVLLIGLLALAALRRRRTTAPPERREELVRRPVYLDSVILSDVLGHLEATDHGRSLRNILEDTGEQELGQPDDEFTTHRDDQVRLLNKAIAAAAQRRDLAVDLDKEPEADLAPGRVVRVTGTLRVLPASQVADLLERGVPLYGRPNRLQPTGRSKKDDSQVLVLEEAELDTSRPPIVAELETPHVTERILLIMDAGPMWQDTVPTKTVSMLAIVDRVLGRRDKLDLDDFVRPHLSLQVRSALGSRDLMEVARPLSQAAGGELKNKDLQLRGPGATVTPAAIWG